MAISCNFFPKNPLGPLHALYITCPSGKISPQTQTLITLDETKNELNQILKLKTITPKYSFLSSLFLLWSNFTHHLMGHFYVNFLLLIACVIV
jgi:hypothetical protein